MNYCGIDLHSNNCVVVVSDEADRILYQKRLRNDMAQMHAALEPYRQELAGVVIECGKPIVGEALSVIRKNWVACLGTFDKPCVIPWRP